MVTIDAAGNLSVTGAVTFSVIGKLAVTFAVTVKLAASVKRFC